MQQAEKAAAETEAEGGTGLRFVLETGVVQLELGQGIPERLVLIGVGGVEPGEHHRLHVPVARQQLLGPLGRVEDGVARAGIAHAPGIGDHIAYLARFQERCRMLSQLEIAHFVDGVDVVGMGAEGDLHTLTQGPVHHPDAGNGAAIAVEVGIEDEGPERRIGLAPRRRDSGDHRFQQLGNAGALLGRDGQDLLPAGADEIHDLLGPALRLRPGEIDLVEDRDDLEPRVHGQKEVGQGLGLHALGGVDHQDRAFAGGQ